MSIEAYALRAGSLSRPGEFPGGVGVRRVYRFHVPAEVTVVSERRRRPPWGLGGAAAGALGVNRLVRADGETVVLPGKVTLRLGAGDRLEIETPGGGGWRPPPGDAGPDQNSRQSAGISTAPKA